MHDSNDSIPAALSPSSAPLANTSASRSLLARLASPLRARAKHVSDFYIKPREPHRRYSPGDIVTGAVVLIIVKPIKITHLTVCLHGCVRVFKNPSNARDAPTNGGHGAPGTPAKSQYIGNGQASLFQDEVTLSGDGWLPPGPYEFNFELDFPSKGLPSSLDFERGTISYVITATLTRPAAIAATMTCEQKVTLVEKVDVGAMLRPPAQTISLKPISKRPRRQLTARKRKEIASSVVETEVGPDDNASQCESGPESNMDSHVSVAPSEVTSLVSVGTSGESAASESTGQSTQTGTIKSNRSLRDSRASKSLNSDRIIKTTIELLKSGCLAGDNLPLKITIQHTKPIKSMHGIIITFYRQGRIDYAPPLSLFTDLKGKNAEKLKHEEYFPKSKTGLGGLSLSSAGSNSVFRKDLAQTFAPILVDPITLTTVVNASVRVPEDVFPTIVGVPGDMISFRYFVEVVVDLGGKLAGQQRHVPRVGTVQVPMSYGRSGGGRGDGVPNMLTVLGGSIIDTDHIRREKSVVACLFEAVVGTRDSARRAKETPPTPPVQLTHEPIYEEPFSPAGEEEYWQSQYDQSTYYEHYDNYYHEAYQQHPNSSYGPNGTEEYHDPLHYYPPPQTLIPPPSTQPDSELTEKERLRRAEERLLPSQPPTTPPAESDPGAGPSTQPAPTSASAPDNFEENGAHQEAGASAPTLQDIDGSSVDPHEDKQELERARLMAEASVPAEYPDDVEGQGGPSRPGGSYNPEQSAGPSAPVLSEDGEDQDLYGAEDSSGHQSCHYRPHEDLPRYER